MGLRRFVKPSVLVGTYLVKLKLKYAKKAPPPRPPPRASPKTEIWATSEKFKKRYSYFNIWKTKFKLVSVKWGKIADDELIGYERSWNSIQLSTDEKKEERFRKCHRKTRQFL
jgi:hypothetical protein